MNVRLQITALALLLLGSVGLQAQSVDQAFFDQTEAFFKKYVQFGLVNYPALQENQELENLIEQVGTIDLKDVSDQTRKAFLINAYNLHVIHKVAQQYPIRSVQDVNGFFDPQKVKVAGMQLSLSKLENELLLKDYRDARLHFVLVCGAIGCPPITDFDYRPELLEDQLEQQTRLAINNPEFIKVEGNEVQLSEIFKWYASDFGGSKTAVLSYINAYRNQPISAEAKVSYYTYDWSLNNAQSSNAINTKGQGNNASRYVVSSTINNGTFEVKIFNNLYTQRTGSPGNLTDRATFFTTDVSVLYGLTSRLNVGLNTRFRRVRNDRLPSSPLSVFSGDLSDGETNRQGLTAIGPQIRYAPVDKWKNFSIQSTFVFPIGDQLTGDGERPFIDWDGATWWTQFFNDFSIGNSFSLFTEIDFLWEDIGSSANGRINRISTPATVIFSYNPTKKITVYGLSGFSPFWQSDFDYFYQNGVGFKYQFTPNFELELLYTDFSNRFLEETGGQAATYNMGIRFNL
ncbi:MAG: DUF547 domain-containing protein [Bacteroidota bacterium]